MPSYYVRCLSCANLTKAARPMSDGSPWPPCRCGGAQETAILKAPPVRVKKMWIGYHPLLAERHNDPNAWIDGERSLRKALDNKKRQGYVVGKAGEVVPSPPTPQEVKAKRDREAKEFKTKLHKRLYEKGI